MRYNTWSIPDSSVHSIHPEDYNTRYRSMFRSPYSSSSSSSSTSSSGGLHQLNFQKLSMSSKCESPSLDFAHSFERKIMSVKRWITSNEQWRNWLNCLNQQPYIQSMVFGFRQVYLVVSLQIQTWAWMWPIRKSITATPSHPIRILPYYVSLQLVPLPGRINMVSYIHHTLYIYPI